MAGARATVAWMHKHALPVAPDSPSAKRIAVTPVLQGEVLALLATRAAPKQIEVALRRRHPNDLA